MDFESEISRLQHTLTVVAEIQRRQAEIQRMQAEGIAEHDKRIAEHDKQIADHNKQMAEIRQTLAEAGGKIDALIDVVDGFIRKPPRKAPE